MLHGVQGGNVRRAARTDANQQEIVEALRKVGATVHVTSHVGEGFPDLVVGFRWQTYLMELKDGDKPPSGRKLTPDEKFFLDHWKGGPAVVVNDAAEALAVLGLEER